MTSPLAAGFPAPGGTRTQTLLLAPGSMRQSTRRTKSPYSLRVPSQPCFVPRQMMRPSSTSQSSAVPSLTSQPSRLRPLNRAVKPAGTSGGGVFAGPPLPPRSSAGSPFLALSRTKPPTPSPTAASRPPASSQRLRELPGFAPTATVLVLVGPA